MFLYVKFTTMKHKFIQREVLLMMHTSFAKNQFYEDIAKPTISQEEKLEEACANGLMEELLPEVFKQTELHKLYLWQVYPGFSFLQLELGEVPLPIEKEHSINPHNFLITYCYN